MLISIGLPSTAKAQCFFVGPDYYCFPADQILADSINWTTLNQDLQTSGINWSSVINDEIQTDGINWDSLDQDIKDYAINWDSIQDQEVDYQAINWYETPNYEDGKTLKARSSEGGGINWE